MIIMNVLILVRVCVCAWLIGLLRVVLCIVSGVYYVLLRTASVSLCTNMTA